MSQYGRAIDGLIDCKACSYMRVMAMWAVTNPAPSCQWSQSRPPPESVTGMQEGGG